MDELIEWIKEDEIIACGCLTNDTTKRSPYDRLMDREDGTYSVVLIYDKVLEEILLDNRVTYSVVEKVGQNDEKRIIAVFTIGE